MANSVIWYGDFIKQNYRDAIPKALTITGIAAVGFVKDATPVDTGYLKSSIIYATVLEKGRPTTERGQTAKSEDLIEQPENRYRLKIGTAVEYAPHVEYGTRAHKVRAKNKPYLTFPIRDKITHRILRWVRKKEVSIPAIKRQSFLRLGILGNRHKIGRIYATALRNLTNSGRQGL